MPPTAADVPAGELAALPPARRPAGKPGRHYEFIDYATQIYVGLVGLMILFFHNERVPCWPVLFGAHAVCMAGIHVLIRTCAKNRVLDFLRHFYPILLYPVLYRETGALNLMFVTSYLDPAFIQLEEQLFGCQPSVEFMRALPYLLVSELFYMSYFSYYVMIVAVGLALYLQDKRRFFHYVSIVSFVFYVCFLTYIFVPVIGPFIFRIEIPHFAGQEKLPFYLLADPPAIQAGPFYRIMKLIYRYFEGHGAAFPSSHVAIAVCALWFSWRYLRRIRYVHLVVVILLSVSTVYCRYHYVVDIPAGVATAAVFLPLGNFLYRRLR